MTQPTATRPACTVAGCDRPAVSRARGWCNAHDKRWKVYGTPTPAHLGTPGPGGRPPAITPNMLEDLHFMADHGEHSHGATTRINQHTETRRTFTRDELLHLLRKLGHSALASQLVEADPVSSAALEDSETASRVLALKDARAAKRRKVAA